jgi:2-methylisocitrate lyase-like PEP mutase family enzyme
MCVDDATIVRFVQAIDAPLNFLAWAGLPPVARLREIGVRRLSAGSGIAKVSLGHVFELAQAFLAEGKSEPLTGSIPIPGGLNANMKGD